MRRYPASEILRISHGTVCDKFHAGVRIKKIMDRILIRQRKVKPGKQMIICIVLRCGGLQQIQFSLYLRIIPQ